ncbi:unnamed protein product [Aureobasidium uvarum]|uniref:Cytochrome b5 heme-binding domain-containing protein n=1 Tax=Aureobasidium uvarum TaxID=2773716 RepID=A0A9N8KET1_9PEZI|nr:unnamed protein product [Aureobasidium uvarum]
MGWLQLNRQYATLSSTHTNSTLHKDHSPTHIEGIHIEDIHINNPQPHRYPPVATDLPDASLPFIPASTVLDAESRNHRLWLVIDNIIYDSTDFVSEHPGGSTVMNSFVGKDCSWQFWRFHTEEHMKVYGRGLRVGRTKGVKNPFREPARYVGLRRLGNADEGWD